MNQRSQSFCFQQRIVWIYFILVCILWAATTKNQYCVSAIRHKTGDLQTEISSQAGSDDTTTNSVVPMIRRKRNLKTLIPHDDLASSQQQRQHQQPRPSFLVSILDESYEHICTGSIIASDMILTTAYCLDHYG